MSRATWLIPLLLGCPQAPPDTDTGGTDLGPLACAWDSDDLPGSAGELALDQLTQGTICPRGDQDWYRLALPAGHDLLDVTLSIDAPIAPLELSWNLWDVAGEQILGAPTAQESARAGRPLRITHGLGTGELLLQVRDTTGNAEDPSHPYQLLVRSAADPDPHEPNNRAAEATPQSGTMTGAISYRGDEDWYRLTATDRAILQVSLASPVAQYQPSLRLVDPSGLTRLAEQNPSGTVTPTEIRWTQALDQPGDWFLVVHDDDGLHDDRDVSYTLDASLTVDPDPHEPNNHPDLASDLGTTECAASWSSWVSTQGTLASAGDVDWYRLDLSGDCSHGVLEATLDFSTQQALPQDFLAELRLVRSVPTSPCTVDQACQTLSTPCSNDNQCELLGNRCLSAAGTCAGAGVCLPDDTCATNQVVATAPGSEPGSLRMVAPVSGDQTLWLVVADNRNDTFAPQSTYTLAARTVVDPDVNEPNDLYTARPPTSAAAGAQTPRAVAIPVHDCVPPTDPIELAAWVPDCCDDTTWVRGSLSWQFDQDWLKYEHPCPGADCMLRVHYQADPGPVDLFLQVFRGNSLWFDSLAATTDLPIQGALSDVYGGLDPADACFYASQKHGGSPFWYYLALRDTIRLSDAHPMGGTWDADPFQEYRVCVEKVANTCESPCTLYTDGCGT